MFPNACGNRVPPSVPIYSVDRGNWRVQLVRFDKSLSAQPGMSRVSLSIAQWPTADTAANSDRFGVRWIRGKVNGRDYTWEPDRRQQGESYCQLRGVRAAVLYEFDIASSAENLELQLFHGGGLADWVSFRLPTSTYENPLSVYDSTSAPWIVPIGRPAMATKDIELTGRSARVEQGRLALILSLRNLGGHPASIDERWGLEVCDEYGFGQLLGLVHQQEAPVGPGQTAEISLLTDWKTQVVPRVLALSSWVNSLDGQFGLIVDSLR